MPGPDGGEILLDHGVGGAAPLGLVTQQAADEADVGGGVDEHPDVEQFDQAGRAQHVGALDDHHLGGAYRFALRLAAVMDEGIDRGGDVASGLQGGEIGDHQFVIAGGHVVEVEGRRVEARQTGRVAIIGILAHQHSGALGQGGDERLRQRALAGAGTSGDGDQDWHAAF